jgi:hypothetical protein
MNIKFAVIYIQKKNANEEHLRFSLVENVRIVVNKFNDLYLDTAF